TWVELAKMSKEVQAKHPDMAGFVFQGAPSESGTVDALEFLYGNGTQILSEDGKTSLISKGDAAEQTFTFLQSLIKTGVSPKVVTTFTEEETRAAFQNGGAVFMRNWPYAESLMQSDKSSKVKGKIGLTTLPSFEGHPPVSVLGGQNFGVSNTSDTPDLAWQAMSCLASAKMQTIKAIAKGELPGIQALYDSPELTSKISYLSHSKKAISEGHNRPTTPYYGDVTSSIYQSYNDLLAMRLSPREAVKKMNRMVQAAIDGKAEI
ncbi:MAG: extracellular solute-binding protein, partial [Thermoleophilia bacterium]|nr:extracellular solute-binding protein [Thermoleophilia bacterium]